MCKRKHKNPVTVSQQVQKSFEGKAPIFVQGSECSHRYEFRDAAVNDETRDITGRKLVSQGVYRCVYCSDERVFGTSHSRSTFRRPIKTERKPETGSIKKSKIPEPALLKKDTEKHRTDDTRNTGTSLSILRAIIEKKKAA